MVSADLKKSTIALRFIFSRHHPFYIQLKFLQCSGLDFQENRKTVKQLKKLICVLETTIYGISRPETVDKNIEKKVNFSLKPNTQFFLLSRTLCLAAFC